jgi:hypothetical protein
VREPVEVMLVRVVDELPEIQRAWAAFETAVGLRGRRFYGAFDPATTTYSVCVALRPGDDPASIGAERGTVRVGGTPAFACTVSLRASTSRSARARSASLSGRMLTAHDRRSSTTAATTSSTS